MANKYIVQGANYCGDGTSAAEAASSGGVGAWNSIAYFEGTAPPYGAIAAGDVIYIRSKNTAGIDMQRVRAAVSIYLGSTAATEAAPITWILDAGAVWSGVDGTLEYTTSATQYKVVVRDYNRIVAARREALVFRSTATATISDATTLVDAGVGCLIKNAKFDYSSHTNQSPRFSALHANTGCVIESPTVKAGALPAGNSEAQSAMFSMPTRRGLLTLIDPDIELTQAGLGGAGLFWLDSSYQNDTLCIGGRVYGAGAITDQKVLSHGLAATTSGTVRCVGFQIPRVMTVVSRGGFVGTAGSIPAVEILGCDGGAGGHLEKNWGWATSRTDNNPPTLSAALPNSNSSPWAWRVYPNSATPRTPMQLVTSKLYTGSAAARTINQEVLVANSMAPNKANLWITVDYTDNATGLPKHVSTQDFAAGALDASAADWTATVWGMITLLKRKLEVTTPTAVKPDTLITVTLWGLVKSATANDIYFVDPDFGVN